MSISRRVAAAVTLLAVATPAPAAARERGHVATDQISESLAIGQRFWHDRDVTPCPTPTVSVVTRPGGYDYADGAVADGLGGCHIELRAGLVARAAAETWRPGTGGDSYRLNLCATIVHELGHTAGLEHTPTGVMSPVAGAAPWDCRVWLRRLVRSDKRTFARSR